MARFLIRFRTFAFFTAGGLAVLVGGAARAENLERPAIWSSDRGMLFVTVKMPNGLFSGHYRMVDGACPGLFRASGRIAVHRVVFSVNFRDCGFFIQWSGILDGPLLKMNWTLTYREPFTGKRETIRGVDTLILVDS